MYQYDDPTVTANLPAATTAGTAGYFTDGNPAGGQAATILRAEFMNMLMMEMVNAITGADITPSKNTFTQLRSAIEAYITARVASSATAGIVALSTSSQTQNGALATVAVTPASLASRTATDARTGLVELATEAEVQTGTDASRAVTPAGLNSAVLGLGQTWQNLTGSRVLGTTYTNSTGRPIVVNVDMMGLTMGLSPVITINGSVSVTGTGQQNAGQGMSVIAVVPNGATYRANSVNVTLSFWGELR